MAISFIMSRVYFCCGAVVIIVSAVEDVLKKQCSGVSVGLIYFQGSLKCHKRRP